MPTGKSVSLSSIRTLSSSDVSRLREAGIKTTGDLLSNAMDEKAERALAKKAGLPVATVREAVNRADLLRVNGIGPSSADLFENAGVNSVKELAQRNADALRKSLAAYLAKHPDVQARLPSPTTVASLVARAKELTSSSGGVSTADQARPIASTALHQYIDNVLFNTANAEGESFREAVMSFRPASEWPQVKAQMHAEVEAFVGHAPATGTASSEEIIEGADKFTFTGRLFGLYTEVDVKKQTGVADRVMVEID